MSETASIIPVDVVKYHIEQVYGFEHIAVIEVAQSGINDYYLISVKDSDNTVKFYFRISPVERLVNFTRFNYQTEVNLIDHLNASNFETIKVVKQRDGLPISIITHNDENRYGIMFEELSGKPLINCEHSNQIIIKVARKLADFHKVLTKLPEPDRPKKDLDFLVHNMGPQIKEFYGEKSTVWLSSKVILKNIGMIFEEAEAYDLNYGLIHGDFQGGNIFLDEENDNKLYFMDYDYSFMGYSLYDVANFTLYLNIMQPKGYKGFIDVFVTAYYQAMGSKKVPEDILKSFELLNIVFYFGVWANRDERLETDSTRNLIDRFLKYFAELLV